jgi:hypothetical protein
MIQLAFDPAYDPFHAAFRFLRQIEFREGSPIEILRLKILDLYLLEPKRCLEIRLNGELKKKARRAAEFQPPTYGHRPGTKALFDRMGPMQDAAIQTLVMQGILDGDAFGQGKIVRGEQPLSAKLMDRISDANNSQTDLMNFLTELDQLPFNGAKGLKDRTGLGEFRYDLV